jgi:hypothetical protein
MLPGRVSDPRRLLSSRRVMTCMCSQFDGISLAARASAKRPGTLSAVRLFDRHQQPFQLCPAFLSGFELGPQRVERGGLASTLSVRRWLSSQHSRGGKGGTGIDEVENDVGGKSRVRVLRRQSRGLAQLSQLFVRHARMFGNPDFADTPVV